MEAPRHLGGSHISSELPDRLDLEWIAVGKRSGLSLPEMNELRIRDLAAYVEIYLMDPEEVERPATQDDIDAFFH